MISRLSLLLGALFFLILLYISYSSKTNRNSITVRAYRALQLATFAMTFTEVLSVIMFYYSSSPIATYAVLRLCWAVTLVYGFSYFYYSYIYINDVQKIDFKLITTRYKKFGICCIIWIVILIAYFFVPFIWVTKDTYTFVAGPAIFYVYFANVLFMAILPIIFMVTTDKLDKTFRRVLIILSIIVIVFCTIQLLFVKNIPILGLGAVAALYLLYFYIENPDLKYIEEIGLLEKNIERSSKAKSDFLSNMSHEIRSPMNAIVGFSATILDETDFDKERVLNDISHIKSSSKNLLDIINNVLDISKVETGSDTLELKDYSLANHIIDWSGIVKTRLENKNIKFEIDMDKEIPRILHGDATKVFQIVLNLLTNAVKYTEVGKIKLVINKEIVSKSIVKLKFKVSDTGFGIKKEDYNKVFQKFSRLDSAKTNEIEGTGLGLVLTKKYAQLMGGDIWFESDYGAGSTFYFDVPQRVVDSTAIGNIVETTEHAENKELIDCSKFTALIVDDDLLNLEVTEKLLSGYKFKIEKISSGQECIYKYKLGYHYDIVFLDHVMPEIDGISCAHVIKRLYGYYPPIVVALTANAITGVREMYLNEGFDEYLSKPIDLNELDRLINKYFKQ